MKIPKFLTYFGVLATIAGLGITIYFHFFNIDVVQIEVRAIDKMRLDTHNVENLTIKYLYQDSIEVNNVWIMRYTISNVGSKTIIAKGNNSNVLQDYLPITIENSIQILSFEVASNFPVTTHQENNKILLDFQQWRRNEYIDIVALVQSKDDINPFISMNERDINDAEVIPSEYRPAEINVNRKFIDHLPRGLAVFLKWAVFVFYSLVVPVAIWSAIKQLNDDFYIKGKFVSVFTFIFLLIIIVIFCAPLLWIF